MWWYQFTHPKYLQFSFEIFLRTHGWPSHRRPARPSILFWDLPFGLSGDSVELIILQFSFEIFCNSYRRERGVLDKILQFSFEIFVIRHEKCSTIALEDPSILFWDLQSLSNPGGPGRGLVYLQFSFEIFHGVVRVRWWSQAVSQAFNSLLRSSYSDCWASLLFTLMDLQFSFEIF